ncbi:hypothetical protein [Bartonella tribocorum]|uniref:hypothetical protein n=1 Tax=Bartonella tribocorum TaxID=85701 RepID=UPI001ABB191D|nr:hypothetical protein [Bartonella tribocorum]
MWRRGLLRARVEARVWRRGLLRVWVVVRGILRCGGESRGGGGEAFCGVKDFSTGGCSARWCAHSGFVFGGFVFGGFAFGGFVDGFETFVPPVLFV